MTKLTLPWGHIYCCTKPEARQMWKDKPEDRGRIWLQDEVRAMLLADYGDVEAAYKLKMNKPGTVVGE